MYKYHCLNPISPVGMGQLDANYEEYRKCCRCRRDPGPQC